MTTVRMDICIIHYTSSMLMNIQHLCDVVTYMYCGIMQNFTPLPSVEGYSSKAWGDMLIKIQNNANIHQAACIINYWRLYLRPNTHGTGGHLTSSHGRRVAWHAHPPKKMTIEHNWWHAQCLARWRLSEHLHSKTPPFLTKWFDPLDLSYRKKLLDLVYIHPWGVRTGIAIFFLPKCHFWNTLLCTASFFSMQPLFLPNILPFCQSVLGTIHYCNRFMHQQRRCRYSMRFHCWAPSDENAHSGHYGWKI